MEKNRVSMEVDKTAEVIPIAVDINGKIFKLYKRDQALKFCETLSETIGQICTQVDFIKWEEPGGKK